MNDSTNNSGNTRPKRNWLFPLGVAAIAISSIVVVSCFHDDDPTTTTGGGVDTSLPPVVDDPAPIPVSGTALACDSEAPLATVDASTLKAEAPDSIKAINISWEADSATYTGSWNNHNAANNLKRLSTVVTAQNTDGTEAYDEGPDGIPGNEDDVAIGDVRPLIVSYGEQVIGDYEPGDGSADVGDPDNIDDIFTSLSLDNGKSWKKVKAVSYTHLRAHET